MLGHQGDTGAVGGRKREQSWTQEVPGSHRKSRARRRAAVLLFKADVSQVSVVDADDAVVLLEEALLLGLPAPLQTLDQQAKSPETCRDQCQRGSCGSRNMSGSFAEAVPMPGNPGERDWDTCS